MVYSIAWNESSPVGSTTNANTIDTELQNLKTSVRERMNQILANDWENDGDDPKLIGGPLDIDQITGTPLVCRAFNSIDQVVADLFFDDIFWDSETIDTGGFHDLVVNNNRLTIPVDGYYHIHAQIVYEQGGIGGPITLTLRHNATTGIASARAEYEIGEDETIGLSTVVLADAGDFYDLRIFQISLGNRVVQGAISSWFMIEKLNGTT